MKKRNTTKKVNGVTDRYRGFVPFPELASHISHGHETGKYHNVRITQEMLLGSGPRLLRCLTTDFITCCTRV